MSIASKQQRVNFESTKQQQQTAENTITTTTITTITKTRNNGTGEEGSNSTTTLPLATTFKRQQQSSDNGGLILEATNREGLTEITTETPSRLPLATDCNFIEASKRSSLNDINNNSTTTTGSGDASGGGGASNNFRNKEHLMRSLEFVNDVIQNYLLDKICWTCNNCHSVPFVLWRSSSSSNNNSVQQQQLKQQQQHHQQQQRHQQKSNINTHGSIGNNSTISYFDTITNTDKSKKLHDNRFGCQHRLCTNCLFSNNNNCVTTTNNNTNNIRSSTSLSKLAFFNTQTEEGFQQQNQQNITTAKCPYDGMLMLSNQISQLQLESVGDLSTTVNLAKELVFCLNKPQGCKKSMPLNDLEAHTKDCLYARAQCPLNCGEDLTVKSLAMGHLTSCPRRPINCDFCDEEIAMNALAEHKRVCLKRPVSCQYCQSDNLIQEELEEHYEICDKKSRPCRFNPVCPFAGTKEECCEHENNWEFHIDLLLRHIINDNMFASKKNRITDIIAIMKDLDLETTSLKSQLDSVTIKLDDMYKQNEEARDLILELKKENDSIKRRLNEQLQANKINDQLKETKEKLAKLETQQKAEGNAWRALVEVLRKEIEALKVTIISGTTSSTSASTPIEKTLVASLVGPPQLMPISQTKPFPIPSTIFEQQENEQDNQCSSLAREKTRSPNDHQHSYINQQQLQDRAPVYSQRQQVSKQSYLYDNNSHKELYMQSQSNNYYAHNHTSHRVNNQSEV